VRAGSCPESAAVRQLSHAPISQATGASLKTTEAIVVRLVTALFCDLVGFTPLSESIHRQPAQAN